MKKILLYIILLLSYQLSIAQVKVLFSANKGEQAGNADWVIDADVFNLFVTTSGTYNTTGNEANPQRYPTPTQSGITATTTESYWTGGISAMAVECVKLGYTLETLPYNGQITYNNTSNPQDLSNYRIYVVCEPNIRFTTAEKTAIMNYVNNGGRLLMVADHETSDRNNDGWESRTIWNDLMFNNTVNSNNPFGMRFDSVDIFQTSSNYTPNALDSILNSSQFGSATQMKFANGTTLTIDPTKNSTVKGHFYSIGANKTTTQVWVASARFGKGKVAGYGDSSPFDDGTGDTNDNLYDGWITDASGNHRKIIMNTMLWLASLDSFYVNITPSGATKFCQGDSATLTATQGINYSWSSGQTTQSIVAKTSGNYNVTVTNSQGQQTSASILITVNPNPTPTVSLSGNILQTSNVYTTYQWYNNTSLIGGATQNQYTPLASGQYKVLVTDTNGCKGLSNLFNYTLPAFTASINPNKDTICSGDSTLLTASAGASYLWSTGKTTQAIYAKSKGIYTVTVTNSSGQTAVASSTIDSFISPKPTITLSGSQLLTQAGYTKYWWYESNNLIDTAKSYVIKNPKFGRYTVKVQDINGCIGISNYRDITDEISITQSQFEEPIISLLENSIAIETNDKNIYTAELLTIDGKRIYQSSFKNFVEIPIRNYSKNIVFLKLSSNDIAEKYYKLSLF